MKTTKLLLASALFFGLIARGAGNKGEDNHQHEIGNKGLISMSWEKLKISFPLESL